MTLSSRALTLLCTAVGLLACARATTTIASGFSAAVATDVDRLRAATNAYHSLDSAVAAGYVRDVKACIVHAHHGGAMGFHHRNAALLDATADVEHPELLLYERLPNGQYQLNGVEFIVPFRFYSRDSVPPVLFEQQMKIEDNLKYWYLHVWAWRPNPNGLFADFHPGVTCPDTSKTDYTPSTEKKP